MDKPQYLIQSTTGDVYHYNDHLALRGDMFPYNPAVMGPIVNGRSVGVQEQAAKAAPKGK